MLAYDVITIRDHDNLRRIRATRWMDTRMLKLDAPHFSFCENILRPHPQTTTHTCDKHWQRAGTRLPGWRLRATIPPFCDNVLRRGQHRQRVLTATSGDELLGCALRSWVHPSWHPATSFCDEAHCDDESLRRHPTSRRWAADVGAEGSLTSNPCDKPLWRPAQQQRIPATSSCDKAMGRAVLEQRSSPPKLRRQTSSINPTFCMNTWSEAWPRGSGLCFFGGWQPVLISCAGLLRRSPGRPWIPTTQRCNQVVYNTTLLWCTIFHVIDLAEAIFVNRTTKC